ncbi:uncharacterized protein LOC6611683 [Drosophila sechellia]|uniref:GM12960 n=1 Tax=Drosophila sechellia TaxID=7238 RepID=B4HYL0_DROSE|nr:uncharacterized protein LOC6611683 [Drosophila sechellia]EDW52140.1 GM12960 [Drosophila sechellia]
MKSALLLICLAFFVALLSTGNACDPDSNNQPDCSVASNVQTNIRNFWDPTRYWWCESSTSTATVVVCQGVSGFDPTKKECVPWNEWTWTPYC